MGLHRIEIGPKFSDDARVLKGTKSFGKGDVVPVNVLTIEGDFSSEELNQIGDSVHNPVVEEFVVGSLEIEESDFALEVHFLPGVTDNVAHTAEEVVMDLLGKKCKAASSRVYFISGDVSLADVEAFALRISNPLIEGYRVLSKEEYGSGFEAMMPKVVLAEGEPAYVEVDLEVSDEELMKISREGILGRGPLALSLTEMKVIRDYFKGQGRKPRDIELEALAQTWSEHCSHKIFAGKIDELSDGLYKHYIKRATKEIRTKMGADDFCVSVFKDNAGAIKFNDKYLLTDKAETHNSPSALDPFGGAITGVVGVNRDALGFGLGSKPIANRYGFCLADPRDTEPLYKDSELSVEMLGPKRILDGVVLGIEAGSNQSGIPGPQGFFYFDERYKGKPLVFAGTVGMIPVEVDGKDSTKKSALNGDLVVVIGGRVGADGIHGATFSSESLNEGSPSTAVQIGDAITQKRLMDAVLTEARDEGLYSSITDNGAGGISCSVAEMAEESGGFEVDLEKVPLKYANLAPWEIWISESQERMTLAIPEGKLARFEEIMDKHGVECTVIGQFNDGDRAVVKYKGEVILDLDMEFLHDGAPRLDLHGDYTRPELSEPDLTGDVKKDLVELVGRLNIASYAKVSTAFDHEVQGRTIIKPLQGIGKVNGKATVLKPDYEDWKGAVMSQGINPRYSDLDTYHMAACAIDSAVRNAVAAGANVDYMALMDNFCWCSSDEAFRLGQLKEAVKACYDYAVAYGTPYISGKDSMFNDFKGYNAKGEKVKISVPPTLLVSALSVTDDVRQSLSMDPKVAGDKVYVLGMTKDELGGSEYYAMKGELGANVPQVDSEYALELYRRFYKAVREEIIVSALSVEFGGLGAALAKKVLAGGLGMSVSLDNLLCEGELSDEQKLFSETQSRFVVTVNPEFSGRFEELFEGYFSLLGEVTGKMELNVDGNSWGLDELKNPYFDSNNLYL